MINSPRLTSHVARLATDTRTREYTARRAAQGKAKNEIMRGALNHRPSHPAPGTSHHPPRRRRTLQHLACHPVPNRTRTLPRRQPRKPRAGLAPREKNPKQQFATTGPSRTGTAAPRTSAAFSSRCPCGGTTRPPQWWRAGRRSGPTARSRRSGRSRCGR